MPSPPPPAIDEHDVSLLGLVRPADWVNPTARGRYNLVVIGAGAAGLVTAAGAAALGAKVAIIERHRMGGECLNVGCVPSKSLIRSAEERQTDFSAAMRRLRRTRAALAPHDSAQRFRSMGVDVYFGECHFTGADAVEVDGQRLRFRKACIATGSRPAIPPIDGLEGIDYLTNETIFDLPELPPRLAVIGAGPIGCELAQAMARLGSRVHLIEARHGVLPGEDPEAGQTVLHSMQRNGLELLCCANQMKVEARGGGARFTLESHGQRFDITVDRVLVAAGRSPNVEALNMEAAGVEYDRHSGVEVDDHLRTTNRRIFAAGDVCSNLRLTHLADAHARIVVRNALLGFVPFRPRVSRLVVPWCTYTSPQVAHVGGRGEQESQTIRIDMADVDRAVIDGHAHGFLKVHLAPASDRIVGATLVCEHAGEIIGQITEAVVRGDGLRRLSSVIQPYPTQAECIRKAADAYQRTRLTPLIRRIFGNLMRWQR